MMIDGAYCYTGGRPFDPALPAVVFIHGAQNDHSVWALQSRYFAHHGFGVLAVDLPGHGRSAGPALDTVEAMADWLLSVLDRAGVQRALLAGHSMGSLIALEAAFRAPGRVSALALVGSTYPMRVSEALLETSNNDEPSAIDMVNIWSHSTLAQKPSCPGPGFWTMGMSQRLMQRMSARNPAHLFHTDFTACNAYANGEAAAASVDCPVLLLQGARDMMTPPKSARQLAAALRQSRIVTVDAGHQMMAEQPDAVLDALYGFALGSKETT
ncbi:alpha/beta fold hydrolase [Pseudoduganella sp. GCM10020061]|uniref:alpha/beta fold hydrolase n=1 Tax=Pseudoduganella sp. GCM10020061 TaxID=3317345 RepID=UPI00363F1A67